LLFQFIAESRGKVNVTLVTAFRFCHRPFYCTVSWFNGATISCILGLTSAGYVLVFLPLHFIYSHPMSLV
jgi:hypothetical protein